ncbi:hypothetical protein [Wenjunlia tyrosinilytica]|uniref:Uncharacterized protein n=1 Tax=Wenjunlia tyrosinilytica TaxID=1544741 RepID=A0A917ZYV6_9ACTN|nr:hypothetical protein [Wenjunlia tyrosinilytica]GGO99279.1 hypothetical protein GCM10012280_65370 [Wenjunlia tyrosinilytica]
MEQQRSTLLMAGVVVALAFFVLVGFLARTLRAKRGLPVTIVAIGSLIGTLPPILLAIYEVLKPIA